MVQRQVIALSGPSLVNHRTKYRNDANRCRKIRRLAAVMAIYWTTDFAFFC